MTSFIGVYECKVDVKGRLMLPSGLKKQLLPLLGDGFVLKRSLFQPCLELYPMSEWEKLVGQVNKLNRFIKEHIDFIRMFTTGLKPIQLDATGRILIPKDLVDFAGIKKKIVVYDFISEFILLNPYFGIEVTIPSLRLTGLCFVNLPFVDSGDHISLLASRSQKY